MFSSAIEVDPHSGAAFAFPLAGDDYRYAPEGRVCVYRSRDGECWDALSNGLPDEPRFTSVLRGAMSVDRLDPCGVYLGTTSGQLFASRDCGDRWTELRCRLPKILCVEAFRI